MKTECIGELQNNFTDNIERLKGCGFESEDMGDFWLVCGHGYSGIGGAELQAWADLLLDESVAYIILECCDDIFSGEPS